MFENAVYKRLFWEDSKIALILLYFAMWLIPKIRAFF